MRTPGWSLFGLAFLLLPGCLPMTGRLWHDATAGPQRVGTAWLEVLEAHWHAGTNGPAFRYRVTTADPTLAPHLPAAGWVVLHDRGDGVELRRRIRGGEEFTFALVRRQLGARSRWRAWTRGTGYYWNAVISSRAPDAERLLPLPRGLHPRVEVEHFVRDPRWPLVLTAVCCTPAAFVGDVAWQSVAFCGRALASIDWGAVCAGLGQAFLEMLGRALLQLVNPFAWLGLGSDDDDDSAHHRSSHRRRRGGSPRLGKPRRARR